MKKTLSVFIPAYNEEKNIKNILGQILVQDQVNFVLEKILVVSDASTDKTVSEIHSLNNPLIEIVENKERTGKWFGFTIAQKKLTSDYIISIDADISIKNIMLFHDMLDQIKDSDLMSIRQVPNKPKKMF
jgi:glycosyltransferase involved in cell wall biosynthesis